MQAVAGPGLRSQRARSCPAPMGEDAGARRVKGRGLRVGFSVRFWSKKRFPMSLRGKRRVDVWSGREVLVAVPRVVAWILEVRWEGLFAT